MPRFRFTIRRMMIAVAVAGVAIGGEMMRRRWASYRDDARRCASIERIALKGMATKLREAESWKSRGSRERGGAGVFVYSGPVEHEDDERWCNLHALVHSRLLCYQLRAENEARWCDSEADLCTVQAKLMQGQAEWFGRLATRYTRAAKANHEGMNLMMLLGALTIIWALRRYLVRFSKAKGLCHLSVAPDPPEPK